MSQLFDISSLRSIQRTVFECEQINNKLFLFLNFKVWLLAFDGIAIWIILEFALSYVALNNLPSILLSIYWRADSPVSVQIPRRNAGSSESVKQSLWIRNEIVSLF